MVYLITYDLQDVKNYDLISERIEQLGNCIRPLYSVWLVDTALNILQLHDYIQASVDSDDLFYITSIGTAGVGRLGHSAHWEWINAKFLPNLALQPVAKVLKHPGFGRIPVQPR